MFSFNNIPVVTKRILLLCVLVFIFTIIPGRGESVKSILALHYFKSDAFLPFQLVTHFFTHDGFFHIFFNMTILVVFGTFLEYVWGPKKFFIFFLLTGILSAVCMQLLTLREQLIWVGESPHLPFMYNSLVGASGALFGLMTAMYIIAPEKEMQLMFIPVPIKIKHMIPVMIMIELVLANANFEWDNISHYGHLSGALVGFILYKTGKF